MVTRPRVCEVGYSKAEKCLIVQDCFCSLNLASAYAIVCMMIQSWITLPCAVLFHRIPASFSAQAGQCSIDLLLFNILISPHCALCGPQPSLVHTSKPCCKDRTFHFFVIFFIVLITGLSKCFSNTEDYFHCPLWAEGLLFLILQMWNWHTQRLR